MTRTFARMIAASLLVAATAGCGGVMPTPARTPTPSQPHTPAQAAARASAGSAPAAVNKADTNFMSGMIPHHAQAVIMAGWAPSHGARSDVRILCERIVVGQRDEIALMRN